MNHRGWLRKILLKIAYAIIAHDPIIQERDRLLKLHTDEFERRMKAIEKGDEATVAECRKNMALIRQRAEMRGQPFRMTPIATRREVEI